MGIKEIQFKIVPILKRHGVNQAAIFGSVARGEDNPDSDIDVLIKIPRRYGLLEFIGIKNQLEDVLKKKVDLVEYNAIKPAIKADILKDQIFILRRAGPSCTLTIF